MNFERLASALGAGNCWMDELACAAPGHIQQLVRYVLEGGSVSDALRLMLGGGVGSVVIVEGDAPVGIVTGTDLLHRVFGAGLGGDCAIAAAMSAPAFVMADSTTVAEAALEMGTRSIRHVVVAGWCRRHR